MIESTINLDSLYSAFKNLKENHGCAGVDGVTIEQYEGNLDINLRIMHNELDDQTYFPLPLLKILVDKGNGEARALCIPTVRDRVVQAAVL
jgi:retron-type reverse transcriptase